ncbi:MAG: Peroxide stress regulator; Ferric uptake regulation protein; Fe2+/Zn2+ uptake regulation proteins, partial [uncultured Sphingomonadaceae bacterium]
GGAALRGGRHRTPPPLPLPRVRADLRPRRLPGRHPSRYAPARRLHRRGPQPHALRSLRRLRGL